MSVHIGDPAPDFALPDQNGRIVRLGDLHGRTVIVFFYPKDDTSGCTAQACGFQAELPTVDAAGAMVIGISPDGQASHIAFRDKYGLTFPLLVDVDHAVADAYGAWGEKSMYGRTYDGIIRSHFVIGPDGRVVDAQVKVSPADSVRLAVAAVMTAAGS